MSRASRWYVLGDVLSLVILGVQLYAAHVERVEAREAATLDMPEPDDLDELEPDDLDELEPDELEPDELEPLGEQIINLPHTAPEDVILTITPTGGAPYQVTAADYISARLHGEEERNQYGALPRALDRHDLDALDRAAGEGMTA